MTIRLPLLLALLGLPAIAAAETPLTLSVETGTLRGAAEDGVASWKGIPFAAPPVGPLRWRAPQPAAPWKGLRDAAAYGHDCMQVPFPSDAAPLGTPPAEDCLYANVWRPAKVGARLPVVVWIYGGGFVNGGSSPPTYTGANLARRGVVFVSFNYRLGRFGTFAHPALSREQAGGPVANYGLMDQIAALRWVKRNIAAFGGDPGLVTIFGESAGASSVNFLMASPMARGLFQRAISESGGSSANLTPLPKAEEIGLAWAHRVGAEDLAALRALPADKVWDGPVTTTMGPVLDGQLVTQATDQAFAHGLVAPVPYLEGFNSQEESLLRWLPGSDERWLARLGDRGPALLALYQAEGLDRADALKRLWGEAAMAAPSRARARAVASRGGKVFLYRYAYLPDASQGHTTGAGHDAEMEMVFANPDVRWRAPWSERDRQTAATMHRYWVNFARSGDPNGPGLPTWPAYDSADRLMNFGDGATAGVIGHFAASRLDAIDAAQVDSPTR